MCLLTWGDGLGVSWRKVGTHPQDFSVAAPEGAGLKARMPAIPVHRLGAPWPYQLGPVFMFHALGFIVQYKNEGDKNVLEASYKKQLKLEA